ncbi:MAG: glycosyltransferase, partial [Oscillospiraceae bacterium]|nr:glycosyltransferase [Oscillospiraceae bacterium]
MKVIHLISGGDVGGAKTHVHTLLKEISKQIDALLVCFTAGDFSRQAEELGIRVQVLDSGFFSTLSALGELIEKENYDLIHCHGSKANMFGAILKSKFKLPVCTTMHSDYKLDYLGRTAKRLTYGTINSLALRRIDHYVCVSDNMAKIMIERGFPAENIFLICNGVDFEKKEPKVSRDEFLASYGIDSDCIVVGIAARLSPIKDIPTLIAAFSEAAQKEEKLRLLIAGDGEEKEKLLALASQSSAKDKIVFAGWLSDTDSFYNAIDINALTSLSEGFPYSIVEGARMGCATVSSDVGGISMLIKNGVTGCLFDPGDTARLAKILTALARSKALREKLGTALNDAGKKDFSLDAMRNTQLAIYETVLARAKRTEKRDGVTLCGAYGQGNSGDDSILEAVISQMRSIDKDMPLRILSRDPGETSLRCRCKSIHSFNVPGFIRAMRRSKLYISGGGTLIQDVTSLRSLVYYLMSIQFAHMCGCKVLMYGCGIGPVSSKFGRWMTKKVLNRCADMATLRDPRSLEELRSMGVTIPAQVSSDPALILPGAPDADVDSAFIDSGVPLGKKYMALALRPWA